MRRQQDDADQCLGKCVQINQLTIASMLSMLLIVALRLQIRWIITLVRELQLRVPNKRIDHWSQVTTEKPSSSAIWLKSEVVL